MSVALLIPEELATRTALLPTKLADPRLRKQMETLLQGRRVFTLYKNQKGQYKEFTFNTLSHKGANVLPAYGKKKDGFSVAEHYLLKQRIQLRNPPTPLRSPLLQGAGILLPINHFSIINQ